jgi:hypothetical protein
LETIQSSVRFHAGGCRGYSVGFTIDAAWDDHPRLRTAPQGIPKDSNDLLEVMLYSVAMPTMIDGNLIDGADWEIPKGDSGQ